MGVEQQPHEGSKSSATSSNGSSKSSLSRGRRSTGVVADSVCSALLLELGGQPISSEASPQRLSVGYWPHCDVIVVLPEADLVARLDAELVTQLFGDHHLTLALSFSGSA